MCFEDWPNELQLKKQFKRTTACLLAVLLSVPVSGVCADPLQAEPIPESGSWQYAYKVRARMISGPSEDDSAARLAFVQLELEPGWKTYWRHPGDAGGIPPEFSFEGSENLKRATVLYPAPHRMVEEIGDTVGYKARVIFPLRVIPEDSSKSLALRLSLRYGICKDICVPTESKFQTTISPVADQSLAPDFQAALDSVPRRQPFLRTQDPKLNSVSAPKKKNGNWTIGFLTQHHRNARNGDLFLEAPAGLFVPLPKSVSDAADASSLDFEISLSENEYKELKGKSLRATVVDSLGASETEFVLR